MSDQGNVHDGNVTEAQVAIIKAITPLIIAMSNEARGTRIIGNAGLQEELRVWLASVPKVPAPAIEKPPRLVFVKKTLLDLTPVTVYQVGARLTFAQMFRALLKLPEEATIEEITKLLKERGHAITDEQFDSMVAKQEKFLLKQEGGEDFGLRIDGWGNFAPIVNADGSVSVAFTRRNGRQWSRPSRSLADDGVWYRERRLVVSNSDALNL